MKKNLEELRHARSQKDFPFLSLEPEEYVELVITRSTFALVFIWFMAIVSILLTIICAILIANTTTGETLLPAINLIPTLVIVVPLLIILILLIAIIATKIHFGNKLYVTNKRAIQTLMAGLFNHSTNVVELSRIEDVSFKQEGIVQSVLHYGTIRMSTVGDETTYTFPYVDTPTDEIQTISHLIHVIKKKDED